MGRILKILLVLVFIVIGVTVGAYALIPASLLKDQVQQAMADATGRAVTITDLQLKRWPPLGFTATGVAIDNAEWAEDPEFATVESIEADVSVWSVVTGSPSALVLTVQRPEIYIEIDENGRGNYEFKTASDDGGDDGGGSEDEGGGDDMELPVRPEIRIENGLVVVRNKQDGTERRFENVSLSVIQDSDTSPVKLAGNVESDGQAAILDGTIASLDSLAAGEASDIDVKLTAPGLDLALTGALDPTAQSTQSKLNLQLSGPRELASWLGQPLEIPEPALSSASLTASIAAGDQKIDVTDLVLKVDAIEGEGEIHADASGERPAVAVTMNFGEIDLSPYMPASSDGPSDEAAAADKPAAAGWPDEPLDLPLPVPADLDVDIAMASLKTPQVTVDNIKALVTADALKTEARLVDLGLYEGTLNTTLTANTDADQPPGFAVDLETNNIALLPILAEFAQFERLQGTGNVSANLTTSGNSVKAIIDNLNGDGAILVSDGAILGFNIGAFMRRVMSLGLNSEADAPKRTDFAELGGTYTIEQGVLTNNDLALRAPILRLAGAGKVDLPQQTLDYSIKPQLASTLQGQDATREGLKAGIPVVISGPWAEPKIQLDVGGNLTSAITDAADVGALVDQLKVNPQMLEDLQAQFDLNAFGNVSEVIGGAVGGALSGAGNAAGGAADKAGDLKGKAEEGVKGLLGGFGRN